MQRVNPEEVARVHQMEAEAEKASARLNMLMNVAAFVVIVGVIRVGACTRVENMLYGYMHVLYMCFIQGLLSGDMSPALRDIQYSRSTRDKYTCRPVDVFHCHTCCMCIFCLHCPFIYYTLSIDSYYILYTYTVLS